MPPPSPLMTLSDPAPHMWPDPSPYGLSRDLTLSDPAYGPSDPATAAYTVVVAGLTGLSRVLTLSEPATEPQIPDFTKKKCIFAGEKAPAAAPAGEEI